MVRKYASKIPEWVGYRTLLAKTCIMCDEFKQAAEFIWVGDYKYSPYCRVCMKKYVMGIQSEHQKTTLSRAANAKLPWTDVDLIQLKSLIAKGWTTTEIALEMGRSFASVRAVKHRKGYKTRG